MTNFMATVYALPLILVDLYMVYGFCYEICYVHLIYPLFTFMPLVINFEKTREKIKKEISDLVIFMSEVTLHQFLRSPPFLYSNRA